ncbi:MAG TPA: universal stress protein [Nitrososphaeraceae archaeon]|jgi:nucleotide-binding universal stress UspA family protein|nr:universal stress protein [Nitrososphaeraceae archaeon]
MSSDENLQKDSYDEKSMVEKNVDDVIGRVKTRGKAIAEKFLDPEKDSEHEHAKGREIGKESPSTEDVHMTSKEIVSLYTPQYRKILVPHDGSESSDKALAHAIYLSRISKAEIIILNAIEDIHEFAPTTISAGSNVPTNEELNFKIKGRLEEMIKERISLCRDSGVESQISYRIQIGKALDQIVESAKESNVDLIIMVSDKIGSSIKGIMSSTRRVIDAVNAPVLVLNG